MMYAMVASRSKFVCLGHRLIGHELALGILRHTWGERLTRPTNDSPLHCTTKARD